MNVSEARKKWKVSAETMLEYISAGIIPDITFSNGEIDIPNNLKLLVPKAGTKIDAVSARKYILKACKDFCYIDYKILCIEEARFKEFIDLLNLDGLISTSKPAPDKSSNKDFTLTAKGINALKINKLELSEVSGEIGFSFKGFSVKTAVKAERRD